MKNSLPQKKLRTLFPFSGWNITPQVGRLLIAMLHKTKPRVTVECGSGLSTLLVGRALQKIRAGRVFSLEHDLRHARRMRSLVRKHRLTRWARILYAPLAVTTLKDARWKWYDPRKLKIGGTIDLLFIDGPPGYLQTLSRYPAGPLLFDRLSHNGLVILDDAHRRDEQAVVKRWLKEFPGLKKQTGRGVPHQAALLRHG